MSKAISVPLPRDPTCGAVARRLLGEHVGAQLAVAALTDAKIVVSELVNNAYVHGQGEMELRMQLLDGRLRVEVVDEGQGAAIAVRQEGGYGGGHGLQIVQSLSTSWGAFEGTTHVWAELDGSAGSEAADPPL